MFVLHQYELNAANYAIDLLSLKVVFDCVCDSPFLKTEYELRRYDGFLLLRPHDVVVHRLTDNDRVHSLDKCEIVGPLGWLGL